MKKLLAEILLSKAHVVGCGPDCICHEVVKQVPGLRAEIRRQMRTSAKQDRVLATYVLGEK